MSVSIPHAIPPRCKALQDFERAYWLELIDVCRGNFTLVAEIAGVNRASLYAMMRDCGVDPKAAGRAARDAALDRGEVWTRRHTGVGQHGQVESGRSVPGSGRVDPS